MATSHRRPGRGRGAGEGRGERVSGGGCSPAALNIFRQNGYDSGKNTWNELLI